MSNRWSGAQRRESGRLHCVAGNWQARLRVLVAGALLGASGVALPAFAMPVEFEIAEVLMEAQGHDAAFLGRYFGPDADTVLHFTWTTDSLAKTFSYTLDSGSEYLGEALSLTGAGAYDPNSGAWHWSTSANRGGFAWQCDGGGQIGDFRGGNWSSAITVGGTKYDFHSTQRYWEDDDPPVLLWRSEGTFSFTLNDVPQVTFGGTDHARTGLNGQPNIEGLDWKTEWVEINGKRFYCETASRTPGEFEMAVCPEPTAAILLMGGVAVFARRRRG